MKLLKELPHNSVHGMANITGGGFRNLARIKEDLGYLINSPLEVPPIFRLVQVLGSIEEREMHQTFNMGMGFCVIVSPEQVENALIILKELDARVVGRVTKETGVAIEPLDIFFNGYV